MDYSHLSDLQRAEFKILKVFDAICKKYNIKYYMADGTLLGAVRHKGFIPWDDDIDLVITRKEYERFAAIADKELPDSMYLSSFDTPGHIWLVPRIIDKKSRFYLNNATQKKEIGAWIDFLIFDGVPNPGLRRKIWSVFYLLARMLYQFSNFSTAVNLKRKRPWYESVAIKFAKYTHIEKILSPVKMGHFYEWICSRYDLDKCKYGAMLSNTGQLEGIKPKEWLGEGIPMQFEGMTILGMQEYDKYLIYCYGDYMQLPPVEKRVSEHNVTKVED